MGIFTYQPFKGVYALGAIGFELARLPLWLVKYLTAYGRQNPEWSFRQALSIRLFFSAVHHLATIEVKAPMILTPGKEKERFIVVSPADSRYYTGPFAPTEDVKPVDIGSTWFPAPLTASSDNSSLTVVFHIHGGAFVIGDGRTDTNGYMASKFLKHGGASHVFMPQYRLSTLPANKTSNPFPAALQDSLTAYLYLLNDLKISPKNIILSGDSAGGNAAIALLRYITEYGADLGIPNPAAAWLWSPWVNPASAHVETEVVGNRNYSTDYLPFAFTKWGSLAYAGSAGPEALNSPYVSMKGKPFKTPVPLFVNTGDSEMLYDDDCEWSETMKQAGNHVTVDVEKNTPHDVLLIGAQLGFDKEADNSSKHAGEWFKGLSK